MNTHVPHPVSPAKLLFVYAASFMIGVVLIMALSYLVLELFDFEMKNSAIGLILVFLSASYVGQHWYHCEREKPAASRLWKIAGGCALLTLMVQGLLAWGMMQLSGEAIPAGDEMILLALGAVLGVVNILLIRWGIGFGVKQKIKQLAFLAAKSKA